MRLKLPFWSRHFVTGIICCILADIFNGAVFVPFYFLGGGLIQFAA